MEISVETVVDEEEELLKRIRKTVPALKFDTVSNFSKVQLR